MPIGEHERVKPLSPLGRLPIASNDQAAPEGAMIMELELARAATNIVRCSAQRMRVGTPDRRADEAARRVMNVLENLGRSDPATRSALAAMCERPDDASARGLLEQLPRRSETQYDHPFFVTVSHRGCCSATAASWRHSEQSTPNPANTIFARICRRERACP